MAKEILFVQGPEKTGTSTITGILNCHPEIFVLFENYVASPKLTKYGNQLLDKYPEVRTYFRNSEDYAKPLFDIFNYIEEKKPSYNYRYIGTKINSLNPDLTQKKQNHKVIFTKRDFRGWLLKESIIKYYRTDLDIVTPTIEYLRFIINSSSYPHAFDYWLDDMINSPKQLITDLSEYLDTDLHQHTENWWEKIGNRPKSDPKSIFRLNHVHHSSRVKPTKVDTKYETEEHPFWEISEDIFNKYRNITSVTINEKERKKDLKKLEQLRDFAPLPLQAGFLKAYTERLGYKKPRIISFESKQSKKAGNRFSLSKIKRRFKKVKDAVLGKSSLDKRWVIPMFYYDELRVAFELFYVLNI